MYHKIELNWGPNAGINVENIFHGLKLGFITVLVKDCQVKAIETKNQRKFFTGNDLGSIGKETVSIPETAVTPETSHKHCRERNLEGKGMP